MMIDSAHAQQYTLQLLEQGHSSAYVNQALSALRFLAAEVFKNPPNKQTIFDRKKKKNCPMSYRRRKCFA
ncbi:hypothetical protein [Paenibacillus macerans]|uniref:hypothetical protein n=1 Tax=Paenibacillus macerans TaxID=44252 RepID=UPI003D31760B